MELRNEGICETGRHSKQNQTQLDQLYQDLANCAEAQWCGETHTVKQAREVCDRVACAVLMSQATKSVQTCWDEDMTYLSHKATIRKNCDDHETTQKKCDRDSQNKKITRAQQTMTELLSSVEKFGAKMDMSVKNLEEK